MTDISIPTGNEPRKPWSGLGYTQVPGLANRLIARYLRYQRKNMVRFFAERGLFELVERMQQIRESRQGMLAKNQMFQEVLNEYSRLATAGNGMATGGPSPTAINAEAPDQPLLPVVDLRAADAVEVQATGGASGDGLHAGDGVPGLAGEDNGPVIEE